MIRAIPLVLAVVFTGSVAAHEHSDVRIAIIRSHLAQAGGSSIVFVGDSITEGALLPQEICGHRVVNAGIGGAGVADYRNALYRLGDFKAEAIVVAIGTNDAAADSSANFLPNYRFLIAELKERSGIILMAGLPPIEEGEISYLFNAAKADAINDEIRTLAGDHFIDLRPPNEGQTIDGIHLSAEGYKPWLKAILSGIKSALHC